MPRDLTLHSTESHDNISNDALSNAAFLVNNSEHDDHLDEAYESEATGQDFSPRPLHTYCAVLTPSNLEACLALEEAVFQPAERCSRDKLRYRLETCNELCLGVFTILSEPPSLDENITTYPHARPIDETRFPGQKQVLIGMIIATKTSQRYVTDESMEKPDSLQPQLQQQRASTINPNRPIEDVVSSNDVRSWKRPTKGHDRSGTTIAIHTLGILPSYQGQGLGKTLLRAYVQRMEQQQVGRRISLIAHGWKLVRMYERLGFKNEGESDVGLAGGGWENLVLEFQKPERVRYGREGMF